jgi:DNA-binding MarR family transcriptional regulator
MELNNQLCFALYTASRAIVRAYGPLLAEAGLTYPQYVTLLALWDSEDLPLSVGDLGERLHLDSGTLTPLLKRLEAMGYVRRRRDPSDERRVLVSLQDAGVALRGRLISVPGALAACVGMDLTEVAELRDRLSDLTDALESGPPRGSVIDRSR